MNYRKYSFQPTVYQFPINEDANVETRPLNCQNKPFPLPHYANGAIYQRSDDDAPHVAIIRPRYRDVWIESGRLSLSEEQKKALIRDNARPDGALLLRRIKRRTPGLRG